MAAGNISTVISYFILLVSKVWNQIQSEVLKYIDILPTFTHCDVGAVV